MVLVKIDLGNEKKSFCQPEILRKFPAGNKYYICVINLLSGSCSFSVKMAFDR